MLQPAQRLAASERRLAHRDQRRALGGAVHQQQVRVAEHDGEEIVQLVGGPGRHPPERPQPLVLDSLRDHQPDPLHRPPHTDRELADPARRRRVDRRAEIPGGDPLEHPDQRAERPDHLPVVHEGQREPGGAGDEFATGEAWRAGHG